jgi:hypothetical protein
MDAQGLDRSEVPPCAGRTESECHGNQNCRGGSLPARRSGLLEHCLGGAGKISARQLSCTQTPLATGRNGVQSLQAHSGSRMRASVCAKRLSAQASNSSLIQGAALRRRSRCAPETISLLHKKGPVRS